MLRRLKYSPGCITLLVWVLCCPHCVPLSTEQSPDSLAWHLSLYNLTVSCCSPNCSMFQAGCAPCHCPSPVCALFPLGPHRVPSLSSPSVTVLPSFKAFLLPILQPVIHLFLFVWVLWHFLHIDSCFIIHDLCFSFSFHRRAHVDVNSASGMLCHSTEQGASPGYNP